MAYQQSTSRSVQTVTADQVYRDASGKLRLNIFQQPALGTTRAVQTVPRFDLITDLLAIDVEFQLARPVPTGKCIQRPGRVSIVNRKGEVIYDVFVYYDEQPGLMKKLPPKRLKLGVYWYDIKLGNGAHHIREVEYYVHAILHHTAVKVVVGHAIGNDMKVFGPEMFKGVKTADTQMYEPYRAYARGPQRWPKLAVLASTILGMDIQGEDHSSVEDAQATMALCVRVEKPMLASQIDGCVSFGEDGEADFMVEDYAGELEDDPDPVIVKNLPQAPLSSSGLFWGAKSATIKSSFTSTTAPKEAVTVITAIPQAIIDTQKITGQAGTIVEDPNQAKVLQELALPDLITSGSSSKSASMPSSPDEPLTPTEITTPVSKSTVASTTKVFSKLAPGSQTKKPPTSTLEPTQSVLKKPTQVPKKASNAWSNVVKQNGVDSSTKVAAGGAGETKGGKLILKKRT